MCHDVVTIPLFLVTVFCVIYDDNVDSIVDHSCTYSSDIIYNLIEGPSSGNFNRETATFNWETTSSNDTDTIIRVTAQDTRYYLLSTHEIVLRVITQTDANTTLPSHANIISFKLIFIFINIIGTFFSFNHD